MSSRQRVQGPRAYVRAKVPSLPEGEGAERSFDIQRTTTGPEDRADLSSSPRNDTEPQIGPSFFSHSQGFSIQNAVMSSYHFSGGSTSSSGLELLYQNSAPSAGYDSKDRSFDIPKFDEEIRPGLIEELHDWSGPRDSGPQQFPQILCVVGSTRTGKTALAQAISEYSAERENLIASFFFCSNDPLRNNADRFIASLAYQVMQSIDATRPLIMSAVEKDPSVFKRSLHKQFQILLLKPIQQAIRHSRALVQPCLVVIDALSECQKDEEQEQILHILHQWSIELPFRIFITSLPEYVVRKSLLPEGCLGEAYKISLDIGHDIRPLTPLLPMASSGLTQHVVDEGRMSISIDFGAGFSGVAYASSQIAGGQVQQILNWPGSFENLRKIPTCLLYDNTGQVIAWGLEAKNAIPMVGTTKCEWFKLFLEPHALIGDEDSLDPRLPDIPAGKKPVDLIVDFLTCLWDYARGQIGNDIGAVPDSREVWLTVPTAWDAAPCEILREAAIWAGVIASARGGDCAWRDRLKIITQTEAAAMYCAQLTDLHHLQTSHNFIVCNAGSETVDLAVYKIMEHEPHLEIAEMCARSDTTCGSFFLDLRFRELVKVLLEDHPAHLDSASLNFFVSCFSEKDKLNYGGIEDDGMYFTSIAPGCCMLTTPSIPDSMFHFTCFNVEDPHDPSVGLTNGQLLLPGRLLRHEVFDPVVNKVVELIESQITRAGEPIKAILLVGGFANSEYLRHRVEAQFGERIPIIARPSDADTASLRGAAQYGLVKRTLASAMICPQSYIMKVDMPAEKEDWLKRPGYIRRHDTGVNICQNRLQFLVSKGATVQKGQRLTTKLCKFSRSPSDSTFVGLMFTSDSDRTLRYSDEGEGNLVELCQWNLDLRNLPSFQQNAAMPDATEFYTEFDLEVEMNSAELRGILLYQGREWARVIFDRFG